MENVSFPHRLTSALIEIMFVNQNENLPYNHQEKIHIKSLVNNNVKSLPTQTSPI